MKSQVFWIPLLGALSLTQNSCVENEAQAGSTSGHIVVVGNGAEEGRNWSKTTVLDLMGAKHPVSLLVEKEELVSLEKAIKPLTEAGKIDWVSADKNGGALIQVSASEDAPAEVYQQPESKKDLERSEKLEDLTFSSHQPPTKLTDGRLVYLTDKDELSIFSEETGVSLLSDVKVSRFMVNAEEMIFAQVKDSKRQWLLIQKTPQSFVAKPFAADLVFKTHAAGIWIYLLDQGEGLTEKIPSQILYTWEEGVLTPKGIANTNGQSIRIISFFEQMDPARHVTSNHWIGLASLQVGAPDSPSLPKKYLISLSDKGLHILRSFSGDSILESSVLDNEILLKKGNSVEVCVLEIPFVCRSLTETQEKDFVWKFAEWNGPERVTMVGTAEPSVTENLVHEVVAVDVAWESKNFGKKISSVSVHEPVLGLRSFFKIDSPSPVLN